MRTKSLLINSTLALIGAALGCASSSAEKVAAMGELNHSAPRIGVFNTRGVAMAYAGSSRSDCMMAAVQKLRAEHKKAEAAGDEEKTEALAAQAVAIQEKIHAQVFSDAPIPEILAMIESGSNG